MPAVASASSKTQQKHQGGGSPPPVVCVYSEMGCGATATGGPASSSSGHGSGSSSQSTQVVPLPSKATRALQASGGAQKDQLNTLATSRQYGASKALPKRASSHQATNPHVSVLSSTIDAGSGMRLLLIVLLASALLIAALVVQLRRRRN